MVFKFFGFKGNLNSRKKVPKEKGDVVCTGYKVHSELYDSLPPTPLTENGPTSYKKVPKATYEQPKNLSKMKGNEVIRGRKSTTKPAAMHLFNESEASNSQTHDDDKNFNLDNHRAAFETITSETIANVKKQNKLKTVVPPTKGEVSEGPTDSSAENDDRKSTLIYLTENHDDDDDDDDGHISKNASVTIEYEEIGAFSRKRNSTELDYKINFAKHSIDVDTKSSDYDSEGSIADNISSHSDLGYSSQAASLFFGSHEPYPKPPTRQRVIRRKDDGVGEGRPSETSA